MTGEDIISCEEALRLLAEHLDGELGGRDHAQVERHLSRCMSCYSRAEFERQLKDQVRSTGAVELPAEFARRVHGLLQQFTVPSEE